MSRGEDIRGEYAPIATRERRVMMEALRVAGLTAAGRAKPGSAWYVSVKPCKRCGVVTPRRLCLSAACLECYDARWNGVG